MAAELLALSVALPLAGALVTVVWRRRSESVRGTWPFLRDRRVDAYADILQRVLDGHDY